MTIQLEELRLDNEELRGETDRLKMKNSMLECEVAQLKVGFYNAHFHKKKY